MSNYVQYLSNIYSTRYDYSRMMGKLTGYNNAESKFVTNAQENYVNSSGINYLKGIQSTAKTLSNSLQNLTNESTFNQLSAVSSDTSAVSVVASSKPTSAFDDATISVQATAAGQANKGAALTSADTYAGAAGTQEFEIEVAGETTKLSVEVAAGDTNKDVQSKMVDAINSANVGVTAQLITHEADKATAVRIAADTTGDQDSSRFQIRDVGEGNLVATTATSTITQEAQNAAYTLNGEQQTSLTNKINIGNGVQVNLKKATTEDVTISPQVNNNFAMDKVSQFVESYNDLLEVAQSDNASSARLERQLTDAVQSYASHLEKIGISINEDYSLSLDTSVLQNAAQIDPNDPEKASTFEAMMTFYDNANYGFANRLSNIASNVQRNPAYYVTPTLSASTDSTGSADASSSWSIRDFFKQQEQNTYDYMVSAALSSAYSMYNSSGSIYDSFYSSGYLFDIFA